MQGIMLAKHAVKRYGEKLVGQEITTAKVGNWPGGRARVLELYHDPAAPEIVLYVKATQNNARVTRAIFAGRLQSDEIGIFRNEEIVIHDSALAVGAGD